MIFKKVNVIKVYTSMVRLASLVAGILLFSVHHLKYFYINDIHKCSCIVFTCVSISSASVKLQVLIVAQSMKGFCSHNGLCCVNARQQQSGDLGAHIPTDSQDQYTHCDTL